MRAITVVVADPEKARRVACLRVLEGEEGIRVIREATNTAETLAAAALEPRILLLDASLARERGMVLVRLFRRRSPRSRIIVLTGHTSGAALLEAVAHGAHGCLNRRQVRAYLPKAVRKVDQGEPWVSRKMVPRIIDTVMQLAMSTPPIPNFQP